MLGVGQVLQPRRSLLISNEMVTGNYKDGEAAKVCLEAIRPGVREIHTVYRSDYVNAQWRYPDLENGPGPGEIIPA